uniref:ubiquitinyl hydrolase 1 n=1 Tax=Heterorhabditis bacteriophora TaxID=37862 RepID=A0A1I7X8P9_HETBA
MRAGCQSPNVNSDDEYGPGFKNEEVTYYLYYLYSCSLEVEFAQRLRDIRGFEIKEMQGDGSCMFRAVADQVYGDEDMHGEVRRLCMDYMDRNRDHFSQFITEDFDEYVARKREPVEHGNHVEMQAISEMYARPVEIYEYSERLFLFLFFVSRESYIEYVKSLERGVENRKKSPLRKEMHSSTGNRSPKSKRISERSDQIASDSKNLPHMVASCSRDSSDIPSTSRVPGLYEELLAMGAYSDWVEGEEEDAMIAQAVLLSQQQFMEDLQREDRAVMTGSTRPFKLAAVEILFMFHYLVSLLWFT